MKSQNYPSHRSRLLATWDVPYSGDWQQRMAESVASSAVKSFLLIGNGYWRQIATVRAAFFGCQLAFFGWRQREERANAFFLAVNYLLQVGSGLCPRMRPRSATSSLLLET